MLKGLIIAASQTDELKETLTDEGLAWMEPPHREKEDFLQALEELQAEPKEVLCLIETDREEKKALEMGLLCVGYLNPDYPEEALSGCRILLEGFRGADRIFFENVHTRALGIPVTIAETDRLLIREMTMDDMDDVDELYREDDSACLFPEFSMDRQEKQKKIHAYISYMYGLYQFGMWVVIEKKSGRLIGRAGYGIADYMGFREIDMGYLIGKAYRRRGYAEEACREVMEYGCRVLDFKKVSAYIECGNQPSVQLIEKLGFCRNQTFEYEGKQLYRYIYDAGWQFT